MKKKQANNSNVTKDSLEQQALSQLNSGKFKEAIVLYKKLLQDTDNSEWHQQIAHCYLQRAMGFAAKGMYKEALVLWENHSQHIPLPCNTLDHYIVWLIQTKNPAKIQAGLAQLTAQQLDKQYPELAALLGFLTITHHPEFAQHLPQDSAFITHLNSVQTALQAYQENNLDDVDKILKQLPYRSAFRGFRSLIKAIIAIPVSIEQTQTLLAKIPADSPYSQTAKMLLACTRNGSELAKDLIQFSHKQRKIIGEIIGLDKKQQDFIEHLVKQKDPPSDKIKFNLALQYQSLCGSNFAHHFCQALLVNYPAGQRDFNHHFGSGNKFEQNRLMALSYEYNDEDYDAEYHWKQCIKALPLEAADNSLKIALILRHMAKKLPAEKQIPLLIESLDHDTNDHESYLKILDYYSHQPEANKDYKQWLDKTIKKFPKDIEVLTRAIKTATHNQAYNKTKEYGAKILQIDPLNTFAKQTLFTNHLTYARILTLGKKYHLVENEIQQAEDLKIGKNFTLQIQLMRSLLCFAGKDKIEGLQLIAESLNKLNSDPVNMQFQAAMEAQLTGLPVATILRELPLAKDYILSAQELTRFIQRLKQYQQQDDNQERIHKAIAKIKAAVKKSLEQQNYDEAQLLELCEILDDINHFQLLRHCSKLTQLELQKPIWMFYRVYSEANGDPEQCSWMNIYRLEQAHEQAIQEKDQRAMILIGNFLDRHHQDSPLGSLEDIFNTNQQDDNEDPLIELFGHLPEEIVYKLNKRLESLIKKTSPEQLAQQMEKIIGNDKNIIIAIMQDPDLFTALILLKAADDLDIDIDVNAGDVFKSFTAHETSRPFPLPF